MCKLVRVKQDNPAEGKRFVNRQEVDIQVDMSFLMTQVTWNK